MKENACLITGVGQRVGLHLARELLARGWPVIGTYRKQRSSVQELTAAGADLVACDFGKAGDLERLIRHITDHYASLRAVVHNASEWRAEDGTAPPAETMQAMMNVHVSAPYQLNLALAQLLQASSAPYADIIHIGDYVSSRGSRKHIAYAASKAAQDNLTKSFAARLAPKVKVNSIAPALILFNDHDDADYRAKALAKSLMHREGGLKELLHQVDYLLQSEYVTGRIIAMDGGRHLV